LGGVTGGFAGVTGAGQTGRGGWRGLGVSAAGV